MSVPTRETRAASEASQAAASEYFEHAGVCARCRKTRPDWGCDPGAALWSARAAAAAELRRQRRLDAEPGPGQVPLW